MHGKGRRLSSCYGPITLTPPVQSDLSYTVGDASNTVSITGFQDSLSVCDSSDFDFVWSVTPSASFITFDNSVPSLTYYSIDSNDAGSYSVTLTATITTDYYLAIS